MTGATRRPGYGLRAMPGYMGSRASLHRACGRDSGLAGDTGDGGRSLAATDASPAGGSPPKAKAAEFRIMEGKNERTERTKIGRLIDGDPSGEAVPRQRAPSNLTRDEVSVWNGIVSAEPADWFSGSTRPLLVQYCRHIIAARRVAGMIETLHAGVEAKAVTEQSEVMTVMLAAAKALDRLQKMQERETRALTSLATKMRLTQQSTRTHRGNRIESRKPWEF